jgi:hypothetical protein
VICSIDTLFHYLFDDNPDLMSSIIELGLQPLSNFPDSERSRQIEKHLPRIFERLYAEFAEATIGKPYINSGVFLTPIDFRLIPNSIMARKTRFRIPVDRLDPEWSAVTYEYEGRRVSRPLSSTVLREVSEHWTRDLVEKWFGVDSNRLFYYVPQIVTYQPGGISVSIDDVEYPG